MSRKLSLVVCLMVLLLIPGPGICSSVNSWKATYKMATLAPNGISWAKQIDLIVLPVVDEVTNGNLTFKVYWGGVMGDDEDYIKKMRIGQLEGAGMSGQGSIIAIPEMSVMELPFLFENWAEVDYVKAKMAPVFDDIAEQHDYMVLAYIDQDFDLFFSSKYDMSRLDHFSRAKVVSWVGELEGEVLKSLGSTPIPVNMPEAPSAIRQGMGNMIIAPPAWSVGTQLYTVFKYISPLKIRYSPGLVLMTWKAFSDMPKVYRDRYYSVRSDVISRFCTAVREENDKCLEAQLKYGLQLVDMPPEEEKVLRQRTRAIWDDQADDQYPAELLEMILGYLEEFRGQQP